MNGVGLSKPKSVDNNHNWLILLNFISKMRKIEMSPAQCRVVGDSLSFFLWAKPNASVDRARHITLVEPYEIRLPRSGRTVC